MNMVEKTSEHCGALTEQGVDFFALLYARAMSKLRERGLLASERAAARTEATYARAQLTKRKEQLHG